MIKELKTFVNNSKSFGIIALLIAASLWGLQGKTTRDLSSAGFSSLEMFALRAIVALVVFAVIILIVNYRMFIIKKEHILFFVFFGFVKIVTDTLCFESQVNLELSLSSTLLATEPYFVAIISFFVFRERLSRLQAASIFLAFFGCVIASGVLEGFEYINPIGILEGVGAGALFGVYTVGLKHATTMNYNPVTVLFYIFLISTIVTIPFVNFGDIFSYIVTDETSLMNTFLFGIAYTIVPYYLQLLGLKNVSATIASVLMLFSIVVAASVGVVFYSEPITAFLIIGAIIMVVAVILLNKNDVKYNTGNSRPPN